MSSSFGHLIIIAPRVSRAWKTHFTRGTVIAAASCLAACVAFLVMLAYTFPPLVNEYDRHRLEAENDALRVDNKNIELKIGRLSSTLQRIEDMSHQVTTQLDKD